MLSSNEEEIDELLRRQIIGQFWNFEERQLFGIENLREFCLPVEAFIHLLEFLIGPQILKGQQGY